MLRNIVTFRPCRYVWKSSQPPILLLCPILGFGLRVCDHDLSPFDIETTLLDTLGLGQPYAQWQPSKPSRSWDIGMYATNKQTGRQTDGRWKHEMLLPIWEVHIINNETFDDSSTWYISSVKPVKTRIRMLLSMPVRFLKIIFKNQCQICTWKFWHCTVAGYQT